MTTLAYDRVRTQQLLVSELIASGRDEPSDLVVRLGDIEHTAATVRFVAHDGEEYREVVSIANSGLRVGGLMEADTVSIGDVQLRGTTTASGGAELRVDGTVAASAMTVSAMAASALLVQGGGCTVAEFSNDSGSVSIRTHDETLTLSAPAVACATAAFDRLQTTEAIKTPGLDIAYGWEVGAGCAADDTDDGPSDLVIRGQGALCTTNAHIGTLVTDHVRLRDDGSMRPLLELPSASVRRLQPHGPVAWCGSVMSDAIQCPDNELWVHADVLHQRGWSLVSGDTYQIRNARRPFVHVSEMGCQFDNIRTFDDHVSIAYLECEGIETDTMHANELIVEEAAHMRGLEAKGILTDTLKARGDVQCSRLSTDLLESASLYIDAHEVHLDAERVTIAARATCANLSASKLEAHSGKYDDLCVEDLCVKRGVRFCDDEGGENIFDRSHIAMVNDIITTLRVEGAGVVGEVGADGVALRSAGATRGASVVINDVVSIDANRLLSSVTIVASSGLDASASRIVNLANPVAAHDAVTLAYLQAHFQPLTTAEIGEVADPEPSSNGGALDTSHLNATLTVTVDETRAGLFESQSADAELRIHTLHEAARSAFVSFGAGGDAMSAGFDAESHGFVICDGNSLQGNTRMIVEGGTEQGAIGRILYGGHVVVTNPVAAELSLRHDADGEDRLKLETTFDQGGEPTASLVLGASRLQHSGTALSIFVDDTETTRVDASATATTVLHTNELRMGDAMGTTNAGVLTISSSSTADVEFARTDLGEIFAATGTAGGYNVVYHSTGENSGYRMHKTDGHNAVWHFDPGTGVYAVRYDVLSYTPSNMPTANDPLTASQVLPFQYDPHGVTTGLLVVQRNVGETRPLLSLRRLQDDHQSSHAEATLDVDVGGALRLTAPTVQTSGDHLVDGTVSVGGALHVDGAFSGESMEVEDLVVQTSMQVGMVLSVGNAVRVMGTLHVDQSATVSTLSAGAMLCDHATVDTTLTVHGSTVLESSLSASSIITPDIQTQVLQAGSASLSACVAATLSVGDLHVEHAIETTGVMSIGGEALIDGSLSIGDSLHVTHATVEQTLVADQVRASTRLSASELEVDGVANIGELISNTMTSTSIDCQTLSCHAIFSDEMVVNTIEHVTTQFAILELNSDARNDVTTGVVSHYTLENDDAVVAGCVRLPGSDTEFVFVEDVVLNNGDLVLPSSAPLSTLRLGELYIHPTLGGTPVTTLGQSGCVLGGAVEVPSTLSAGSMVSVSVAATQLNADSAHFDAATIVDLSVGSAFADSCDATRLSVGGGGLFAESAQLTGNVSVSGNIDATTLTASDVVATTLSTGDAFASTIDAQQISTGQLSASGQITGAGADLTTVTTTQLSASSISAGAILSGTLSTQTLYADAVEGVLSVASAVIDTVHLEAATATTLHVDTCSTGALTAESLSVGGMALLSGWEMRVDAVTNDLTFLVDGNVVHRIRYPSALRHPPPALLPYAVC